MLGRKDDLRIAILIPAGPRDDILDTLASVVRYADPRRVILVIDDTQTLRHSGPEIRNLSSDITVIAAPTDAPGTYGGLWLKLAAGYRWILERYEPRMVLRLDADALLIGEGIEEAAEEAFARASDVGLLGSFQYGPDGGRRDFTPAARCLRSEAGLRGWTHPKRRRWTRRYLSYARMNGYIDGEHVLGGAYIHSYSAIKAIYDRGWFTHLPWLANSKVGEDHRMSLLTMAAGYRIGDFGAPSDPLALCWQGLPAHPRDLLSSKKLVVHSVRYWDDLTEAYIRNIFANERK